MSRRSPYKKEGNGVTIKAEMLKDTLNFDINAHGTTVRLCGKEIWWMFDELHYVYNRFIGDF